jgi:hypothetical protein
MTIPNTKLKDYKELKLPWFELLALVLLQSKGVHNLMQLFGMGYGFCIPMSLCKLRDE